MGMLPLSRQMQVFLRKPAHCGGYFLPVPRAWNVHISFPFCASGESRGVPKRRRPAQLQAASDKKETGAIGT